APRPPGPAPPGSFGRFRDFGEVVDAEVLRLSRPDGMAFSEKFGNLILGRARGLGPDGGDADAINPRYCAVRHLLLHGRVRHDGEIILVLTVCRLAFRC